MEVPLAEGGGVGIRLSRRGFFSRRLLLRFLAAPWASGWPEFRRFRKAREPERGLERRPMGWPLRSVANPSCRSGRGSARPARRHAGGAGRQARDSRSLSCLAVSKTAARLTL